MTQQIDPSAPWSLHFDRDGTEDIAIICDAAGDDLVRSRHFWLPEGDDPIPPTLAAIRLMTAAPELLEALREALAEIEYFHSDMLTEDERRHPRGSGWVRIHDRATAAIAKAEGRAA